MPAPHDKIERSKRVRRLFEQAAPLHGEARRELIDRACPGDPVMRAEVERLLERHDQKPDALRDAAGTAVAAISGLQPGTLIARRFEIVRKIGDGGMGEVYEVRDIKLGENVALKKVRARLLLDSKIDQRFKREILNGRRVTHPNVCRIYDLVPDEPLNQAHLAFTMELLSGETLADALKRERRLSVDCALPLVKQMSAGLAALHDCGIVHRDFKPANVMLIGKGDDVSVKITDFGLAMREPTADFPGADALSGSNDVVGTPVYMAPEQLTGDRDQICPATDVYALGLVLYEMVTGRRAFAGTTYVENLYEKTMERPTPPREHQHDLPVVWNDTLLRCLEIDPANRPQSPLEVYAALEGRAKSSPANVLLPPDFIPEGKNVRRFPIPSLLTRGPVLAGVALLTLLVAALLVRVPRELREPEPVVTVTKESQLPSVVVLPVINGRGDPDDQYLCDGLTDELIAALTSAANLRVIGRNSTFQSGADDLGELGANLGVRFALRGRLTKTDGLLRLAVQLVDVTTEEYLWSKIYDGASLNLIDLREKVAVDLASSLGITLAAFQARAQRARSPDPEAYDLYLKGLYFWNLRGLANLQRALGYFQEATDADPEFAPPYAGIAGCYAAIDDRMGLTSREAGKRAEQAASRALMLDPDLASAHLSRGLVLQRYYYEWRVAEAHFRRAIELEPGSVQAHHWYAGFLSDMGRGDQAAQEIARAIELDPLSIPAHSAATIYHFYAREYDRAIEQGNRTLELQPSFSPVYRALADSYLQKGMLDEAASALEKCVNIAGEDAVCLAPSAYCHALAGRTEKSRGILTKLERLEEKLPSLSFDIALVHTALGDNDQALSRLEELLEKESPHLTVLKVHPGLDRLRSHSRFKALLEKMEFL